MRIEFLQEHLPFVEGQVVDHPDPEFVAAVVSRGIAREAEIAFENHGRHLGVAADTSAAEASLKAASEQVKKLDKATGGKKEKAQKSKEPKKADEQESEAPITQPEPPENPQGS